MRRRTAWQRRKAERDRARAAAVPDVVRDPADAAQQMRFFDQLGPQSRAAIATSRFDADAVMAWRNGYRMELKDDELAARLAKDDARNSGSFGPRAPAGI